jgi:hypothetical protein
MRGLIERADAMIPSDRIEDYGKIGISLRTE